MNVKKWLGSKIEKCDVCHNPILYNFVDGKTVMGPWGILCPICFTKVGVGLGIGRGQLYKKVDEEWICTAESEEVNDEE